METFARSKRFDNVRVESSKRQYISQKDKNLFDVTFLWKLSRGQKDEYEICVESKPSLVTLNSKTSLKSHC